jgi:hypothetical protein
MNWAISNVSSLDYDKGEELFSYYDMTIEDPIRVSQQLAYLFSLFSDQQKEELSPIVLSIRSRYTMTQVNNAIANDQYELSNSLIIQWLFMNYRILNFNNCALFLQKFNLLRSKDPNYDLMQIDRLYQLLSDNQKIELYALLQQIKTKYELLKDDDDVEILSDIVPMPIDILHFSNDVHEIDLKSNINLLITIHDMDIQDKIGFLNIISVLDIDDRITLLNTINVLDVDDRISLLDIIKTLNVENRITLLNTINVLDVDDRLILINAINELDVKDRIMLLNILNDNSNQIYISQYFKILNMDPVSISEADIARFKIPENILQLLQTHKISLLTYISVISHIIEYNNITINSLEFEELNIHRLTSIDSWVAAYSLAFKVSGSTKLYIPHRNSSLGFRYRDLRRKIKNCPLDNWVDDPKLLALWKNYWKDLSVALSHRQRYEEIKAMYEYKHLR